MLLGMDLWLLNGFCISHLNFRMLDTRQERTGYWFFWRWLRMRLSRDVRVALLHDRTDWGWRHEV